MTLTPFPGSKCHPGAMSGVGMSVQQRNDMPRTRRQFAPGHSHHVFQRGNNRLPTFQGDEDRGFFLACLCEASRRFACDIGGYVLMANHYHLLVTPWEEGAISRMVQCAGRRYVGNVNKIHDRSGTLWEGRFKSSLIDSSRYALACLRYIDLNPVRAGIAGDAVDYRWSSYRHHAGLLADPLVTDHPVYLALADSRDERGRLYAESCTLALDASAVDEIRKAIRPPRGRPPEKGSESFRPKCL